MIPDLPSENAGEVFLTSALPDEAWPLIRDFHYSKRMPSVVRHIYAVRRGGGLFGDFGECVACAMFSYPPTRWSEPVVELIRLVKADGFSYPLTKLISFSCRKLKQNGCDLVVSYADQGVGHHGGIYQASGWLYAGKRQRAMDGVLIDGTFIPGRMCNNKWGTRSPEKLSLLLPNRKVEAHYDEGKHLYFRALTKSGRKKADRLGLATTGYPKPALDKTSEHAVTGCAA